MRIIFFHSWKKNLRSIFCWYHPTTCLLMWYLSWSSSDTAAYYDMFDVNNDDADDDADADVHDNAYHSFNIISIPPISFSSSILQQKRKEEERLLRQFAVLVLLFFSLSYIFFFFIFINICPFRSVFVICVHY